MKTDKVYIIGGGAIGLASAYYALRKGLDVTVLDAEGEAVEGCSFGNAGMIVPSHFVPLAAPGMISKGIKWMFKSDSPFAIRPSASPAMAKWGYLFWKHANAKHVEASKQMIAEMNLVSRELFAELQSKGDFGLNQKGLLMLCKTQEGLDAEAAIAAMAGELGVKATVCTPEEAAKIDPNIEMDIQGGVWFEQDCHLTPELFMKRMREHIVSMGGTIRYNSPVKNFIFSGSRVNGLELGSGELLKAHHVVIAAGAWTPQLTAKLGFSLSQQAGKGYSITLPKPVQLPNLCSIFSEAKVAITPMGDSLRFAGMMEVGAKDLSINKARVGGMINSVSEYFPQFKKEDFENVDVWAGMRPCSPDGVPYIGRVPKHGNVVVASGHAMMGLSLAPITGQMVSDLLMGGELPGELALDRF